MEILGIDEFVLSGVAYIVAFLSTAVSARLASRWAHVRVEGADIVSLGSGKE